MLVLLLVGLELQRFSNLPFGRGSGLFMLRTYRLVQAYRPKFLQSPTSTPFLSDETLKFSDLAQVFNVPLPSPSRMNRFYVFIYCWPDIRVLYFFVFSDYKGSHISRDKKNNRKGLRRRTLNTLCEIQRQSLENGVNI